MALIDVNDATDRASDWVAELESLQSSAFDRSEDVIDELVELNGATLAYAMRLNREGIELTLETVRSGLESIGSDD